MNVLALWLATSSLGLGIIYPLRLVNSRLHDLVVDEINHRYYVKFGKNEINIEKSIETKIADLTPQVDFSQAVVSIIDRINPGYFEDRSNVDTDMMSSIIRKANECLVIVNAPTLHGINDSISYLPDYINAELIRSQAINCLSYYQNNKYGQIIDDLKMGYSIEDALGLTIKMIGSLLTPETIFLTKTMDSILKVIVALELNIESLKTPDF
jgi:hypothetical protein